MALPHRRPTSNAMYNVSNQTQQFKKFKKCNKCDENTADSAAALRSYETQMSITAMTKTRQPSL
jgi:hypothetical protein